jgi:cytochrome d ubiquinol oxidase subunit I
MEAHFETERGAGLWIGGIPDMETQTVNYGFKIPKLLSLISYSDINAEVKGLNDFPKENWPPVVPVHIAFQIMVSIGMYALFIAVVIIFFKLKKKNIFESSLLLKLIIFGIPLGVIAVEAGWIVTEVGRQPWIIYEILKTKDSVTPMPGLEYVLLTFGGLYLFLSVMVTWLMWRQFKLFQVEELKGENENA